MWMGTNDCSGMFSLNICTCAFVSQADRSELEFDVGLSSHHPGSRCIACGGKLGYICSTLDLFAEPR